MNRIFQKFLQSVIDLSSVRARCCEDNTHDIDMNPDAEALSLNGRFILTETSGSLQERTVPEQKSDWISNLNGLDIIGLFPRHILATRVLSWIFVCVPWQRIFANL